MAASSARLISVLGHGHGRIFSMALVQKSLTCARLLSIKESSLGFAKDWVRVMSGSWSVNKKQINKKEQNSFNLGWDKI